MDSLASAFAHLFSPEPLALMMLGTALGVMVGAVPGLTGAMLIALTLPLTYGMESSTNALVLLVSMYVGSISGGLITATLLRMPGTPASIMTTLDGYPLARSGKPGRALGLGISASFIGGLVSWGFLALLARPMAQWSTALGPYDLFSLVMMALVLIASVSGKSLLRGLLAGALGVLTAMPGVAPATGELRMTFGLVELNDGFKLLPVLIGLFAVGQIIRDVVHLNEVIERAPSGLRGMFLRLQDWRAQGWNLLRSSLIGTWIGILPGIGANIGSVVAYSCARLLSKNPQEFGQGSESGIVASEAANNATVGGALIPLISLGIPGSVIDAILLGALVIHNLQPGPLLFKNNPEAAYTIIATALVANCFMFVFMLVCIWPLSRLMYVPRAWLVPVILVFCVIGSFTLNNRLFDVWVMLGFGLLGFAMDRLKIPLAPFVIGLVLAPVAEENLVKGLALHQSLTPLLTQPISAVFLIISALLLAATLATRFRRRAAQ